jgi:DNA-binding transcriptional LysR family regulator
VVHGLVAAGLGVALVPRLGLADTDGVLAVALSGRPPRRAVLALHRPAAASSLISAALAAIRATSTALD